MSVDKFGRVSSPGENVVQGPPGVGFKLTPDGNYNMQFKLITNLGNPAFAEDAVNLGTVETWVRPCLKDGGDGKFNAKEKIITNLGEPKELTDAVSLGTLAKYCVLYHEKTINAGDRTITRVKDPRGARDVANKQYVDKAVPTKTDNSWGFGKRRLVNVADPIDGSDVVTKKYLKQQYPVKDKGGYDFDKKRLMNVDEPVENQDAATLHYCKNMESRLRGEISGDISSNKLAISTINEETNRLRNEIEQNKRNSEKQLRKFGQLLYPYLHNRDLLSATSTGTPWNDYIHWDTVFNNAEELDTARPSWYSLSS